MPHITHWHGFSPVDTGQVFGACPFQRAFPRPQEPQGVPPTCVDTDMPLQSPRVSKLPLAVDTHVGLLPTVDAKVPLEVPCGETKGGPGMGHHWVVASGEGCEGSQGALAYLRW